MKYAFYISLFSSIVLSSNCFSETVVWKGKVKSDGTPTEAIALDLHKNYQIKVSGEVNLGKWWQGKTALGEDAAYEYNGASGPSKISTFQNSMKIPLDADKYKKDHIYLSHPFLPKQNKIHFWISDEDYSDNTGDLSVEIVELPK